VAGGFLDLAAALVDASGAPVESWAETLAEQTYNLARAPAAFTRAYIVLNCAAGSGPVMRAAGELRARSAAGNYYISIESASIRDNGATRVLFQADESGAIIDPPGGIDLVTPLSGVTCTIEAASVVGGPIEPLPALVQRCRDRWPALSAIPTEARYAAWTRQCSTDHRLGIQRITTAPSEEVAGQVVVYVADAGGTASVEQIAVLQSYMNARRADELETVAVVAAESLTVVPSGAVWCRAGSKAIVQAAAVDAWNAYLASIPIGGEMPNHCIRCSRLEQILMDAGAFDTGSLQLNNGGVGIDILNMGAHQVPASSALGLLDPAQMQWSEV